MSIRENQKPFLWVIACWVIFIFSINTSISLSYFVLMPGLLILSIRLITLRSLSAKINGSFFLLFIAFIFSIEFYINARDGVFTDAFQSMTMGFMAPDPTLIVVDDVTGVPIKGAVALAIWRKHSSSKRAWWEGGTTIVNKTEEGVSDENGHINLKDFWKLGRNKPSLNVYKFGYVCWDREQLFQQSSRRTDFDRKHRVIKMQKWPENFSFVKHESFISFRTQRDIPPRSLFGNALNQERFLQIEERRKSK